MCTLKDNIKRDLIESVDWTKLHEIVSIVCPLITNIWVLWKKKKFWEELLSLIRHGPNWKRCVRQFFYCCMCIRYRSEVSTEPLPSNDKGISIEPLPSSDRGILTETLTSNDKGTFTEPLPSNDKGDTQTDRQTHRHTHTEQRDLISLLYFIKIKKKEILDQLNDCQLLKKTFHHAIRDRYRISPNIRRPTTFAMRKSGKSQNWIYHSIMRIVSKKK
jgi:hypothetical protein